MLRRLSLLAVKNLQVSLMNLQGDYNPEQANRQVIEKCNLFRQLSTEIAALGESVQIKIIPFYDPALIHFSKLGAEQQDRILVAIRAYLEIYQATLAEGSSVLDSARVIWNTLVKLGYKPTSDIFSHIKNGNIIEIHDNHLVQIFRNINFFNFCSYSLEDLYCYQITDLYKRDFNLEKDLMMVVTKIYKGEVNKTIDPGLRTHFIDEKISLKKLKISAHIQLMSPLYSAATTNGLPVATLAILSAELSTDVDNDLGQLIPLRPYVLNVPDLQL